MNPKDANAIILKFYSNPNPSAQERFFFEEAMEYMIATTKDPNYIVGLGSYYRGIGRVDLAMRYFNQAIEMGDTCVYECLAAVYLDETSGMKDYAKAFEYFAKAWENGSVSAYLQMAEMYRNGWGVAKDEAKYRSIIEDVYKRVGNSSYIGDPVSEVCIHMGEIRRDQGRVEEAIELFFRAREFLARRISIYSLDEDYREMERLILSIYDIVEFDEGNIDLYDLFYVFQKPSQVHFWYRRRRYTLSFVQDADGETIFFEDRCFRSLIDFMQRGTIAGEPVVKLAGRLYGMDYQTCA